MPSKNDLTNFKVAKEAILNAQNTSKNSASDAWKAMSGRKPLPKAERRTEQLMISLTPAEMNAIDAKRGLADRAVYVRHVLGSRTDVFKNQ